MADWLDFNHFYPDTTRNYEERIKSQYNRIRRGLLQVFWESLNIIATRAICLPFIPGRREKIHLSVYIKSPWDRGWYYKALWKLVRYHDIVNFVRMLQRTTSFHMTSRKSRIIMSALQIDARSTRVWSRVFLLKHVIRCKREKRKRKNVKSSRILKKTFTRSKWLC